MAITLKEKLSTLFRMNVRTVSALLSQKHEGYLKNIGWFEAFDSGSSVDKNCNPIPWLTYPFIEFISKRLKEDMEIFEFGSGNSTFFYSDKVKTVTTIEHDKKWFEKIRDKKKGNVEIIYIPLDEDGKYCRAASVDNRKYDIIIIDAEDRVNCILNSIKALKENGVIILDDSERDEYSGGIKFLLSNYFKRIDFEGISPGKLYRKSTTVFYKNNNCLNI